MNVFSTNGINYIPREIIESVKWYENDHRNESII